jgi:hypothetical protein
VSINAGFVGAFGNMAQEYLKQKYSQSSSLLKFLARSEELSYFANGTFGCNVLPESTSSNDQGMRAPLPLKENHQDPKNNMSSRPAALPKVRPSCQPSAGVVRVFWIWSKRIERSRKFAGRSG